LKVNTITCVIWGQKPNRLLTKERSRTSETHIIDGQTIGRATQELKKTHIYEQHGLHKNLEYPVYFLVATTPGFIQVACSRVQPRKVTIEKKDEINEYKKKEKTKRRAY
jgi:hypothetical protein